MGEGITLLRGFNKAMTMTSATLLFMLLFYLFQENTSSSSISSLTQREILADVIPQNITETLNDDGCIVFSKCTDKCACARYNTISPREECRNDATYFNYLEFNYCVMNDLTPLSLVLMSIWLLLLFYLLVTTTEQYFCPSLSKLSKRLRLSESVAGVTFLAFSNGSPDLFSAFSAFTHKASAIGVTFLLGSSIFVTSFILGIVCVISPNVSLAKRPFLRDIIFYMLSVAAFFAIVWDANVHLWESISFLSIYILYVVGVFVARYIFQRMKKRRREALGIIEHSGEELFEVKEIEDDAMDHLDDILFISNVRSWNTNTKYYNTSETDRPLLKEYDEDDDDSITSSSDSVSSSANTTSSSQKWLKSAWYRALSSVGWAELNVRDKLMMILLWPIALARALTIPSAGPEGQWSRFLAIISPVSIPLLIIFAFKDFGLQIPVKNTTIGIPVFTIVVAAGIIVSIIIFFTTTRREPPRYFMVFIVAGFISSSVWMYLISNEVISVIRAFGRIINVSESILGMTIVAWAISIVDVVSNYIVTKQGFTDMAVGACFGAPTFSLLLSLGISITYKNIVNWPRPYHLKKSPNVWNGFIFSALILVVTIIFIPANKFQTSRPFGIVLIVLYVVFSVMAILTELNVVPHFL
eukprot:TRINITY_DN8594_c0_g1_i1.p1 TRINITY_DN8594_c0_g1~~TRINITY_DN8594_c0_g1_i1.p1  ORF type:complete len:641 (-),score=130.47 TRINITY_DN8594_c0_g1_i1:41-1963(-)